MHHVVDEELLLFSFQDGRAHEAAIQSRFEFSNDISPLYDGNQVIRPVPIMVEGTYHLFDRTQNKWREVKITENDIKDYFSNTPRDVAINYEHNRQGPVKGWVRLKDTGHIGKVKTKQGEKFALFSALELLPETAADVTRGLFRDLSIELKNVSREVLGLALTGYPVMKDVQFYSNTPNTPDAHDAHDVPAEPVNTPTEEHSNPTQPEENVDRNTVLADALQEFGLTPQDLPYLRDVIRNAQQEQEKARLVTARDHVRQLVTNAEGHLTLAPGAIEAAAQLYAHASEQETLEFSVDGNSVNLAGLVDLVLQGVQAIQVFGETPGTPIEQIQAPEPVSTPAAAVDQDRVKAISAGIKDKLKRAGVI